MPNPNSPMLTDATGIAMVAKLQDIASAISSGGGGGGGGGSVKRRSIITNTKIPKGFLRERISSHLVNDVPANLIGKYIWYDESANKFYYTKADNYGQNLESYSIDPGWKRITNKEWGNFPPSYRYNVENIWNYAGDVYYSDSLKLDRPNDRWNSVSSSYWGKSFDGSEIWTDGTDIYVTNNASSPHNYVLDTSTDKFIDKTITNTPSNFVAKNVWIDRTDDEDIHVYYSNGQDQYEYNIINSEWVTKTWSGMSNFYGRYIWEFEEYSNYIYYYSYKSNSSNIQQELDSSNSSWSAKTWNGLTSFSGDCIWTDHNDHPTYFYSDGSQQYQLASWDDDTWFDTNTDSDYKWGGVTKPLTKVFSTLGCKIWTDGKNIFYSSGRLSEGKQYMYNKATQQWNAVSWKAEDASNENEDIYFNGEDVWSDGKRIFVSNRQNSVTYCIQISDMPDPYQSSYGSLYAVSIKDENDNDVQFDGKYVWSDGEKMYLSDGYTGTHYTITGDYDNDYKYVLVEKTWEGPTGFDNSNIDGYHIWTDGENIYHSGQYGQYSYMFNDVTEKWESKSWFEYGEEYEVSIDAVNIWTDGKYIFCNSNDLMVLDKATNMWVKIEDNYVEGTSMIVSNIWSDGESIFTKGSSYGSECKVIFTAGSTINICART